MYCSFLKYLINTHRNVFECSDPSQWRQFYHFVGKIMGHFLQVNNPKLVPTKISKIKKVIKNSYDPDWTKTVLWQQLFMDGVWWGVVRGNSLQWYSETDKMCLCGSDTIAHTITRWIIAEGSAVAKLVTCCPAKHGQTHCTRTEAEAGRCFTFRPIWIW